MDPPIQTEYFLSGGAMILIFMVGGARAVISFCILSAIPGNTVLAYRSFLMLRRSNDLDLHGGWCKSGDLLLHPVGDSGEHGVGVQILPDVNIALHDGVVTGLVDSGKLNS